MTDPETVEDSAARIAELESQLKAATLAALRTQIAAEAGLPPKLAARLQGETEADLRRDAEDLRALAPTRATTTRLPSGAPPGETDVQRRARIFGGGAMFSGGRMVYNGDPADLDEPV
jgi:hypothetical protein